MRAQMLTTIESLDAGSRLSGRYRILGKIGEGGFGVVYKARDTKRKRRLVAIKQIDLATLGPRQIIEATDSYNREVTILSQLQHRNLPRVYEHFTDPTHWYLVMQYIEGETLEDYLKRAKGGQLSMKEVCAIGVQLASMLAFLHSLKPPVIFRDVKPANIMRTRFGRLYLIDFGIARRFTHDKTRDTGPLGSPGYAAPEQYGRAQSTEQTDIYGLGATLQTLLTGREPFEDEPTASPTYPPDPTMQRLQQALDEMLAANAADRPYTMREVKERLRFAQLHHPRLDSVLRKACVILSGMFIGSLPYLFWPILWPYLNYQSAPGFIVPFAILFFYWWAVLFAQCVTAVRLFFNRRRLLAATIVVMLALVYLAILLGWLPSPTSIFHSNLFESLS